MNVLCFGSLNIDYTYKVDHFVQKGETISSRSLQVFSGGKGLNQSIALAKAGARVFHAGAVGTDGLFLTKQLLAAGVNTDHVTILEDVRTGNAIIQNDSEGDNCIILYGGANQAITRQQVDDVVCSFSSGDYLVLQNEINELPYIVEKAHAQGMKIVLNPSPMNEKITALPLEHIDCFMLNEVEAGQLLHTEEQEGELLAARLSDTFPHASIVLTLGKKGAVYRDQAISFRQRAYPVKAVDTTAAGDTFTGFFLAGITKGLPPSRAMDLAARASAIAVTRPGAAPSIPTAKEVARWEPQES